MVLLVRDKTECPLCHKIIRSDDSVIAFTAFLKPSHRFARFSDGVFHERCFCVIPESSEVLALYEKYQDIWKNRPSDLKSLAEIEAWGREAFKIFK